MRLKLREFIPGQTRTSPLSTPVPAPLPKGFTQRKTKEELAGMLTVGKPRKEIEAAIGEPLDERSADDGSQVANYLFPPSNEKGAYIAGFTIVYVDGKLQEWVPVTAVVK
jgi:hypothetical protein